MVFDSESWELSGVWDFSRVSTGYASFDFRYLMQYPKLVWSGASKAYESASDRPVDLAAATLMAKTSDLVAIVRHATSPEAMIAEVRKLRDYDAELVGPSSTARPDCDREGQEGSGRGHYNGLRAQAEKICSIAS
jgi:hypothetical protein